MMEKMRNLENKMGGLMKRNEELEKLHHRHIVIIDN